MKKVILTITIMFALVLGVEAQSDGFFAPKYKEYARENSAMALPALPEIGTTEDQSLLSNVPLGSGLLFLAGMGLAYGLKKNKKS